MTTPAQPSSKLPKWLLISLVVTVVVALIPFVGLIVGIPLLLATATLAVVVLVKRKQNGASPVLPVAALAAAPLVLLVAIVSTGMVLDGNEVNPEVQSAASKETPAAKTPSTPKAETPAAESPSALETPEEEVTASTSPSEPSATPLPVPPVVVETPVPAPPVVVEPPAPPVPAAPPAPTVETPTENAALAASTATATGQNFTQLWEPSPAQKSAFASAAAGLVSSRYSKDPERMASQGETVCEYIYGRGATGDFLYKNAAYRFQNVGSLEEADSGLGRQLVDVAKNTLCP